MAGKRTQSSLPRVEQRGAKYPSSNGNGNRPSDAKGLAASNGAWKPTATVPGQEDLRDFIENAAVPLHKVGPDGIILWANQAELDLLGYPREEYVGHHIARFHADEPVIEDVLARLTRGETLRDYEARLRCKDGSLRHVLISSNVFFENGEFVHTRCFTRDVTREKHTDELLGGHNRVLQQIAEGAELEVILRTLTRMIEAHSEGRPAASILVLDEEGRLRHGAAPSLPDAYNRAIDGVVPGPAVGSCGTAVFRKQAVVVEDIANDPLWVDFRELAATHGLRACWSTPIFSDEGAVLGTFALYHDQSRGPTPQERLLVESLTRTASVAIARKRADEALRRRAAQFESLLNAAPLGVYLVDADFRIREVNPTAMPVFGNIPDLIGRDFDEVLHILWPKACADEIAGRFRHTLETGEPYVTPERIEERPDRGEREYYEWQINRIPLPEGHYGVVCYFRDVSRQVLAREAIAESEERFRMVADNMSQLAWTCDLLGNVTWYNQRWLDYTGLTFEEMQGWGWRTVQHPDHIERVVRRVERSRDTGETWEDTFPLRGKDGRYRWFLSRALPIRDREGRVVRWFGTNTDITEQLDTERELRQANEDLEQFAYSASHDLQEPIRNISVYGEILNRRYGESFDAKGKQYLGFMTDGARRVEALVRDLLAYTQSARSEDEADKVDAAEALINAIANLAEAIRESGAAVSQGVLPTVRVHEVQLRQLFQNLIGNAIKYRTDSEAPRIHIGVEREGEHWRFAVQDNGVGIPPEHRERIFGIFKRLHTDAKYSGTGIGLAICQRIVQRNGGRIWVESNGEGKGSTFYFTLPAEGGR